LMSRLETLCQVVLLDFVHLGLNSLENLLEFLRLQRDHLVVVGDLLNVLNLFSLSLRLHFHYAVFELRASRVLRYHFLNDLITPFLHASSAQ
jgi:hypothetical protein